LRLEKKFKYVLHEFKMGDVEDVEVYIAEPIYQWQQTEHGKWCSEKATNMQYHINQDFNSWGYHITITGELSGKHATFYALKRA